METGNYSLKFHGEGMQFFKIQIVNIILCIVTLGLYYPWAKAKTLTYLYSQTAFEQNPFVFTGTGAQMFKGFIKAFLLIIIFYAILIFCVIVAPEDVIQLVLLAAYLFILMLIPLVIHGSYRYRMAKTEWRGIRFGYQGKKGELIKLFYKGIFFTIISFGIYGAWFQINLRKYLLGNIRMGSAHFSFHGEGEDYFWLNIKGYFLTILTLGIYSFWWQKDLFNFFINHMRLSNNDKNATFTSTATGGGFAGLMIINLLLMVVTLGLAYPWIVTRTLNFVMNNISINGDISFDELIQTQADYSDATAEDMADFFDFGFIV